MNMLRFREAVEASWGIDTTYCVDDYAENDRSYGQCAVTAVLVQDHFLGLLMAGTAVLPSGEITRHYWNRIGDIDVDLTWKQFPNGTRLVDIERVSRMTVLANQWMRKRFETLRDRFNDELQRSAS